MSIIHLCDYKSKDFETDALCGEKNVKTMSDHEIKRSRITCGKCLLAYAKQMEADRLACKQLRASYC